MSFVLAWSLIWYLALYGVDGPIQWGLLATAGALLGVPGAGEVISRVRGGTDGSGSESVSSDLLLSSRSSLPHNEASGEIIPPMT